MTEEMKFVKCPDGSVAKIIGFDSDIGKEFVFIKGAKCFVDGPDYTPATELDYRNQD